MTTEKESYLALARTIAGMGGNPKPENIRAIYLTILEQILLPQGARKT